MRDKFHFDPADVAVEAVHDIDRAGRDLHLEIGFGKDIRILREAQQHGDAVYLGVEISGKKARKFCEKVARRDLRNVFCYHGDVRVVLGEMLEPASVASFTILFPDPWPKRKQRKHRWIQEPTAAQLVCALKPEGQVIVATDHDEYSDQIRGLLAGAGLTLEVESREVPEEDRSLFAERFERLGESVTYQRWRKP